MASTDNGTGLCYATGNGNEADIKQDFKEIIFGLPYCSIGAYANSTNTNLSYHLSLPASSYSSITASFTYLTLELYMSFYITLGRYNCCSNISNFEPLSFSDHSHIHTSHHRTGKSRAHDYMDTNLLPTFTFIPNTFIKIYRSSNVLMTHLEKIFLE